VDDTLPDAGSIAEILSPASTTDAAFCSFTVTHIDDDSGDRLGCTFRASDAGDGDPGEHLEVTWANDGDRFRTFHRISDHNDTSFINDLTASCTSGGCAAYTHYAIGDILSVAIDGTGPGDDRYIKLWNHGSSAPSDLHDPETWGDPVCHCDDTDIENAPGFVWIDRPGTCGLQGRYINYQASRRPAIDNFACGSQP
jgi:hypothetical protein